MIWVTELKDPSGSLGGDGEERVVRSRGTLVAWMGASRRCTTLAERLSYDAVLLSRPGFRRPWSAPFVYPVLAWRTLRLLARERPRRAIVVGPPFLLALLVRPVLWMTGTRWVLDVHSGALLDRRWRWSVPLLRLAAGGAVASIVTLPSLADRLPGRVLVLPDPLPFEGDVRHAVPRRDRPLVVAICGWGDDEPIETLLAAARGHAWDLALTGRPRRPVDPPPNARLTGFLGEGEYRELVGGADAIVVLTTREDTLLSGAWEAVALRRPLVLSRTRALRETFGGSVTYVEPTAASIAAGIEAVLANAHAASSERDQLAAEIRDRNDEALEALRAALA